MSNKITFNTNISYEPIIELYRGKIYCNIIKYFIIITTKYLDSKIFSVKKSYPRTLTNILSSWIFTLYAFNKSRKDPFFPDDCENIIILKRTLLDFCKYDSNIINSEEIVDNILNQFIDFYIKQLEYVDIYKKSSFYLNNLNNYEIYKKNIIQKRNNIDEVFLKFKIKVNFGIKDKRLLNILDNILLPLNVYNRMKKMYTGDNKYLDVVIWIIIFRYQLLGSNNNQLAVLPSILDKMKIDYNISFECFASSINATMPNYCSIYHDIEKYFGSHGNFFDYDITEGSYSFNPPYQKDIMDSSLLRVLNFLQIANDNLKKLTFIITIPIWDKEGQEILNQQNKVDYGEFEIIKIIKDSLFFKGLRMISKENFTYIDHNFKLYKNKTIQNTYIILLSTDSYNIDKINNYNFNEII
jgi:hypothetical protein